MAPRFKGHGGFDFKLIGLDGATKFLNTIGHNPELLQGIRSLYLGVTVEGLDEYVDDMMAAALNMMIPGNVPHILEKVKIFIAGIDYMEMHVESICSPAASRDAPYHNILYNRDPPASLLASKGVIYYKAERAFIRALLNIRGVKRVEVEGPMPAELKKRIGACLTTRPGCKVRSWKGEQSAFRTDAEIGWGTWVASMHSRDETLDDTVGPDGVDLADTTALHHGLDVSYHVSFPVPPSPRPEDDRTIWNKPPFRFPSPPSANDDDDNNDNTASAPRRRTNAAVATTNADEPHDSFSSPITSDPKDDDFVPDTSSPIKPSLLLRRRHSTPLASGRRKRLCVRSPLHGGSLSSAALDAYDAKRALGFPASPAGTLHRVNNATRSVHGDDDGGGSDFGRKCDNVELARRMTWFRDNRRVGQRRWILPTAKGARVEVARRVEREGRGHICEDDDDDYEMLSDRSDCGSPERRGQDEDEDEDGDGDESESPDAQAGAKLRPYSPSMLKGPAAMPHSDQGKDSDNDLDDVEAGRTSDTDMEDYDDDE